MDDRALAILAGGMLGKVMGVAFFSAVGTFFTQIAARIAAGFIPSYGNAFKATFFGHLLSMMVGYLVSVLGANLWVFLSLTILIGTFFYTSIIKSPDGVRIDFNQALIISIIQLSLTIGLFVIAIWSMFGRGKIPSLL